MAANALAQETPFAFATDNRIIPEAPAAPKSDLSGGQES
jgi:hypothetical protein